MAACRGATALGRRAAARPVISAPITSTRRDFWLAKSAAWSPWSRKWSKDARGRITDVNDDWFVAGAELDGGVTASFEASRVTEGHPLTGRIEVDGTLGTLRWEM